GMHPSGHVRMYAPNPIEAGSSVSHWDVTATPNLLMEPKINPDLTSDVDLTDPLFRDIGWLPRVLDAPGSGSGARVALANNPNPARGGTDLHFELAADERVELSLYDVSGRQVRSLVKASLAAGPGHVRRGALHVVLAQGPLAFERNVRGRLRRQRQQQPLERVGAPERALLVARLEPGLELAELVPVVAQESADDVLQHLLVVVHVGAELRQVQRGPGGRLDRTLRRRRGGPGLRGGQVL